MASEGRLDIVLLIQQQSHNRWAYIYIYIYNVTTPLSQHEDSSYITRHCDIKPTGRSTSVRLLSGWKDIPVCCQNEKTYMCVVATSLRSPSIESSGVLYISPTHTSSMQELIMQGLQQKLEKSCFRCNKNTWHVESNHILQPPNYLIIVVNRFRYINNQLAKDKCSIPMDMTVVLGYHKFSLQATIDHHGPSIYSGHYTTSVNCCNRTFFCNDNKITEFDMINTKNSSTAYVVIYKLMT